MSRKFNARKTETKTQVNFDQSTRTLPEIKTEKKINWEEISCDLALVLFGYLFSKEFFEKRQMLSGISLDVITGLFLAAGIAIAWLMGFTLASYKNYYPSPVYRLCRFIIVLLGISLLVHLLILGVASVNATAAGTPLSTISVVALFFLILGPIITAIGFNTGYAGDEPETKKGRESVPQTYIIFIGLIVTIWILISICFSDFVQKSSVSFLYIIAGFFGSAVIGVLSMAFMMWAVSLLKKLSLSNALLFILQTLLPFLITSSLIFLNTLQQSYTKELNPAAHMGMLFLTGILPFRLVLAFKPPIRTFHLLLAIASLSYFMYGVLSK